MVWSGDYFSEQPGERLIVACLSSGSSAQSQGILQSVFMYCDLKPAHGMLPLDSAKESSPTANDRGYELFRNTATKAISMALEGWVALC